MATSDLSTSLTKHARAVQEYYNSLESKAGYRLLLGDTRHFGYYPSRWSFPLRITRALRMMETKLADGLDLKRGDRVLDAGCGFGHVALSLAKRGLLVVGIDLVDRHVRYAQDLIARERLQGRMSAQKMDYHDLSDFASHSFDGAYTMETLVHAVDPLAVLKQFHRVVKPGGALVLHEYDHADASKVPPHLRDVNSLIDKYAATPGYTTFEYGVLEDLLKEAGFVDIKVRDFTDNVMPMIWLFYVLAVIPLIFIRLIGLEHYFVNAFAGVWFFKGRSWFRYIQVTAKRP